MEVKYYSVLVGSILIGSVILCTLQGLTGLKKLVTVLHQSTRLTYKAITLNADLCFDVAHGDGPYRDRFGGLFRTLFQTLCRRTDVLDVDEVDDNGSYVAAVLVVLELIDGGSLEIFQPCQSVLCCLSWEEGQHRLGNLLFGFEGKLLDGLE